MKKIMVAVIVILITASCSVNRIQEVSSTSEQELAKAEAAVWSGRVQMYYSADHKYLYFEYSLDLQIGEHYSHLTQNGKFYILKKEDKSYYIWEVKEDEYGNKTHEKIEKLKKVVIWLNHRDYACQIINDAFLVKVPSKSFLKNDRNTVHFSWVINGKYYSLVNQSPFACSGNSVNSDYHFEAVLSLDYAIIAYEDY